MEVYGRLCTWYYDVDKPHPPDEALAYYLTLARQEGGPVLEPMCGSGRYLLPFAEAGLEIVGTDVSAAMLDAARERVGALGVEVHEVSVAEMDLGREFAFAFVPAGSLSLLADREEMDASLRALLRHLRPGGLLVADLEDADQAVAGGTSWTRPWLDVGPGEYLLLSGVDQPYDAEHRIHRSLMRYDWIRDGRLAESEFQEFRLRLYDPPEAVAVFEAAGFTDVRVTAPLSDAPFVSGRDDVMQVSARRPD